MVVIAGLGHLAYGSGIPKSDLPQERPAYATILNDAGVERDIANYLVFPQPLEGTMAPKIMAVLSETGEKVSIADLPQGSVSKKAGMHVGDRVISLDNVPVQGVDDMKIALFYKKSGETVTVKVVRKQFLLGEREMEFIVNLP